ncbi:PAQR family membrane homeostasis protein TrhA [Haliovirga abyssi]|uniref:Hemolysin D n=1 Tax=Haliovirga abyssi TaxID=2996794 RepID=A0AAU9DJ02_9FUSO|nr:hemolysin III family protein [Haliovirga abyssi]BDU51607.1 hemolysin D [Haliovirga abyssi]
MKIAEKFTLGEEIASSVLHGIGAIISILALVLLIIKSIHIGDSWHIVSYTIFGTSLIILYTMSTLYHAFPRGTTKRVFQRFDHLSIYILIAGTYTPFCLTILRGKIGWTILIVQWGLAILGIIFKSIWIDKFVAFATLIYILMGWAIVLSIKPLAASLDPIGIYLLVAGGISYTVGTIFFIFSLFKFHHAVWHIFVMLGSLFHFLVIYIYLK